jgi:hypothetical protein
MQMSDKVNYLAIIGLGGNIPVFHNLMVYVGLEIGVGNFEKSNRLPYWKLHKGQ